LEGLIHTPASVHLTVHHVLLYQGLAVLDGVDVALLIDLGSGQESVRVLLLLVSPGLGGVALLDALGGFLLFDLDPTNGNFKKLILPFGIKCLFMEEVLFFELIFVLFFPGLDVSGKRFHLALISEGILSHLVDGDLQLSDPLVLYVVVGVLHIKGVDQLSQFFFLSLDVNVVGLQIFILLLP
jgi:hypothetical protein